MKRLTKVTGWAVAVTLLAASAARGQVPQAPLPAGEGSSSRGVSELLIIPDEAPQPPPHDIAPPEPTASAPTTTTDTVQEYVQGELVAPVDPLSSYQHASTLDLADCVPVAFESSGTWLRRGFWYAEADAVILNREFNKRDVLMAIDESVVSTNSDPTVPNVIPQLTTPDLRALGGPRTMRIRKSKPGVEGMPKVTIGRFLFRDRKNRDHSAEFTIFGGGQWFDQSAVESIVANALQVPFAYDQSIAIRSPQVPLIVDPFGPRQQSFDFSSSQSFQYGHRFNSFEVNYRVRQRMRRDQMILLPDGEWVRRASPSRTWAWLAGFRYFDVTELLNWSARDIRVGATGFDGNGNLVGGTDEQGHMRVMTDNDMFGLQFGLEVHHERPRWSVGLLGKAGPYLNRANIDVDATITGDALNVQIRDRDDVLSFIGEFAIMGKFHLRPNLSLRTAFQILYADATAVAPFNVTFNPDANQRGTSAGLLWVGTSFGVEGYW